MRDAVAALKEQDSFAPAHAAGEQADIAQQASARPTVGGKFLFAGGEKLWVKGVTYGTFRPRADGCDYPEPEVVARDFAAMREAGINALRTYTVPPRWLLDAAQNHGLRVMAGLPWEQHITFLDDPQRISSIESRVRDAVRSLAGHPALLCWAIGNEIPASVVRWHGRVCVERFLHGLYRIAKQEDPGALVTYVNFPTTEYLHLPFLDFVCFNVYLESKATLEAYFRRLQNLAGERPLVMAEIGLDSRRNGEAAQAGSLAWQVPTAFAEGCAGTFVFSWTDEWHRGGHDIEDWDFGLTTRDRRPKPALEAVRKAYAQVPFPDDVAWPRISVVICSYNGARTIRDALEGLKRVDYPNYEVIVVNDGSKDATPAIAGEYDVKLISTENRGLSNARNTGWQNATGEIVAYLDDDAYPDPHWLKYLARAFITTSFVGIGGPNLAPAGDGWIADCVANSPGGPVHVLVTDQEAEHIPGCNMAFRRSALEAVGGLDPRYRAAGDDVDLCWRLQQQVGKIGFHAAAMVWHHRRNSVQMYWKQQQGYGKAEALLEEKWPEKYNAAGHLAWVGRLYGKGLTEAMATGRWRVYHGSWGSGLFQSLYQPGPGTLLSLPLMPEWYLVTGVLLALTLLGVLWPPLLLAAPLLALAVIALLVQAVRSAARATFTSAPESAIDKLKLYAVTAYMHLMQPMARLIGRLRHGLTPWRRRVQGPSSMPLPRRLARWSETWRAPEAWLRGMEQRLRAINAPVLAGGDFDDWDLEVRGGALGLARLIMGVEEHGAGRQLLRFRIWPRFSRLALGTLIVLGGLAVAAALDGAWVVSALLLVAALAPALRSWQDCAVAATALEAAVMGIEHTSAVDDRQA